MSAHTPEVWAWGLDDIDAVWAAGPETALPGNIVCRPPPARAKASLEEWPRRARLIAAAPELLSAAKLALPSGVCLTNPNVPDDTVIPVDFTMGELRQIAAAIAKATIQPLSGGEG